MLDEETAIIEEELVYGALRRERLWQRLGLFGLGFGILGCLSAAAVAILDVDPPPVVVPYDPATGFALTHVTTIEFGTGESIRSIIAGDTEGFEIDGVPGGRAFAIKPVARGVHTNVTVYTNRRSYYFNVNEVSNPTFYVVQFRYPEDNRRPANAIARAAPNYNYGASARTEFTPTRVWDDGTFTYFAIPRNAPVPAIFRYTNGRERTVNTGAVEDGVIRVSGVGRQWVLRLGEDVVCIEATPPVEAAS